MGLFGVYNSRSVSESTMVGLFGGLHVLAVCKSASV